MPKRVFDADAAWSSSKLARCKEEFIPEYAWLYGLADANGNFEYLLRVIHGKVAAIRPHFTLERLKDTLDEFERVGLLYVWNENGKRYGHWTRSELPGRLPPLSQRNHYPTLELEGFRRLPGSKDWDMTAMNRFYQKVNHYIERANGAETLPLLAETEKKTAPIEIPRASEIDLLNAWKEEHFQLVWRAWPTDNNQTHAHIEFMNLTREEISKVLARLPEWLEHFKQNPGYEPLLGKWLVERNFEKAPKELPNGTRQIAPPGGSSKQQRERIDRIYAAAREFHDKYRRPN